METMIPMSLLIQGLDQGFYESMADRGDKAIIALAVSAALREKFGNDVANRFMDETTKGKGYKA